MFPREIVDLLVEASTEDFCSLLFVSRAFWLSARAILFRHTTLTFHVSRRPNRSVTLLTRVVLGDPSVLHLIKTLTIALGIDPRFATGYFINDENFRPLLHHLQTSPIHTLHVRPIDSAWFAFAYLPPGDLESLIALRSVPSIRKLVITGLDQTPATLVSGTNQDDSVNECILTNVDLVDAITFSIAPAPQSFKPIYPFFQTLTRLVLDHAQGAHEALFPLATTKSATQSLSLPSLTSLTLCVWLKDWVAGEDQLQSISATLSRLISIAPGLQTVHLVQDILGYPPSWQESELFDPTVGLAGVPELQFSWKDRSLPGGSETQSMFASMALVAGGCLALRDLESLVFTLSLYMRLSTPDTVPDFVDEAMQKLKGSLRRHRSLRRLQFNLEITPDQGVEEALNSLRVALQDFTINDTISFEYTLDIVPT